MDTPRHLTPADITAVANLHALHTSAMTSALCTAELINESTLILNAYTDGEIPAPVATAAAKVRLLAASRLVHALAPATDVVEFAMERPDPSNPPVLEFSLHDKRNNPVPLDDDVNLDLLGKSMTHIFMHPSLYEFWIDRTEMFAIIDEVPFLPVTETLAEDEFCHEERQHLIAIAASIG